MNPAYRFLTVVVPLLLGAVLPAQVRVPEFREHDRGNLWETMNDNGTIGAPNPTNRFEFTPSMDWPGGPHTLVSKDDQRSYNYAAGMWIGGRKSGGQLFFTENGPFTLVDNGTFSPITKQTNYIGSAGFNVDEAEEIITASWVTTENVAVKRISRAWSVPGYENFLLIEYQITNQGTGALTDVFIGFPYLLRPSYQDFVVHNGWGDDLNRADDLVRYDSVYKMLYSYDDTPNFSLPNDVGNYWAQANELRTTGYAGVALLSADPASDARPQPSTVFYAQLLNNERYFTLTSSTIAQMYAILSGADRSLQAPPDLRLAPFVLMGCGPYTLAPGASVKIVLAHAVNGLPISVAIEGLAAQSRLPEGLGLLQGTIEGARELFRQHNRLSMVPPPSPDIAILALPSSKSISVTWLPVENSYVNPLTGASNILGYRVYRSSRGFIGPFSVIREVDVHNSVDQSLFFDTQIGRWKVLDPTISLGVSYFYAVTTYDSLYIESGYTNRNETGVKAASLPAATAGGVKVFPNPFHQVSGFPTLGEEQSIVWSHLPQQATVRIFTAGGDLVRTLHHNNALSGEEVWDQLSDARQRVAPGVYFWTVESPVGASRGTVVIIK